jgi:DNA-binding XRE family transcriptional regulator
VTEKEEKAHPSHFLKFLLADPHCTHLVLPNTQAAPSQNQKSAIFANAPDDNKITSSNKLLKTNVQYIAPFINKVTTFDALNNFTKKGNTINFATKQMILENKEKFIRDYRIKMGDTIKNIREKKGYSQDELAEIMKVNRTTISKIENGKFNLSIDYLSKFSWFLDFEFQLKETKNNKSITQI